MFYKDDLNSFHRKLIALRNLDEKIEQINSLKCHIENFLFGNQMPIPYQELEDLIKCESLLDFENNYLKRVKMFLDQFKVIMNSLGDYGKLNNIQFHHKICQILEFSMSSNIILELKEEMKNRLYMEYNLVIFFKTYFDKDVYLSFPQYEKYLLKGLMKFKNFEEYVEYFKANTKIISTSSCFEYYKEFILKYQEYNINKKVNLLKEQSSEFYNEISNIIECSMN